MSLSVTHEVWRKRIDEPGVVTFSATVLRIEGERAGDGWALRMHEQGTAIVWPAEVLTPTERESVEARLEMAAKWEART